MEELGHLSERNRILTDLESLPSDPSRVAFDPPSSSLSFGSAVFSGYYSLSASFFNLQRIIMHNTQAVPT